MFKFPEGFLKVLYCKKKLHKTTLLLNVFSATKATGTSVSSGNATHFQPHKFRMFLI